MLGKSSFFKWSDRKSVLQRAIGLVLQGIMWLVVAIALTLHGSTGMTWTLVPAAVAGVAGVTFLIRYWQLRPKNQS